MFFTRTDFGVNFMRGFGHVATYTKCVQRKGCVQVPCCSSASGKSEYDRPCTEDRERHWASAEICLPDESFKLIKSTHHKIYIIALNDLGYYGLRLDGQCCQILHIWVTYRTLLIGRTKKMGLAYHQWKGGGGGRGVRDFWKMLLSFKSFFKRVERVFFKFILTKIGPFGDWISNN